MQPPETDDSGSSRQPEPGQISDEENYSHQRRLQAIQDAREFVVETRNRVENATAAGNLTRTKALQLYRSALESYIIQIMPVLESDEIEFSEDYKTGVPLGTVELAPPEEFQEEARGKIDQMPPGAGVPTAVTYSVEGLETVLKLPDELGKEFSYACYTGREMPEIYREQVSKQVPKEVLDNGVYYANRALEEAELGLKMGEGRPSNQLASEGGQWPWERDDVLPHEIHDAIESGEISPQDLAALVEDGEAGDQPRAATDGGTSS
jgi:hypothetical protein